ncbi:type VI secretion system tube protein TssD [Aquimarina aggregata]|uniref:type VI secretion system tube protein TssD n=1 Tax=Aquimarina aggregata TaxID=1642818 RepID=UPI0024904E4D|nr:type VI secretion system tube protein TssD [Aquimarina aggregata]
MSFKAVLYIEDQERTLIDAELIYAQMADINGRPTQLPMGAPLVLNFASTARDELFYDYMFSPNRMCKGYIRFFKRDGMQKDFDIEFANAHIIGLKEHFSSTSKEPMSIALTISYGISRVKGIIHEKKWNPSNPFAKENTPITVRKEKKPIEVSYVEGPFDESGNKIKYISPKHEYFYHATLKNYSEGDNLGIIQWSVAYDDDNTVHEISNGGSYEDGVLKTSIRINKGKHTATIYAHIGIDNLNANAKVTYKQVVTFFIGGAGDKEPFYTDWKTEIMKDVADSFNDKIHYAQYSSYYLGYNEVKGNDDIEKHVLNVIPNSNGTKINIVGHSLGGWNGAHLSEILTKKGYLVDTLVTLDPVGEGGTVTLISDIHLLFPNPKMNYWINIYTDPENYKQDDFIADFGGQWFPRKQKPHVMYTSKYNHGQAKEMFNEIIARKTISPASLLLTSINEYLENK